MKPKRGQGGIVTTGLICPNQEALLAIIVRRPIAARPRRSAWKSWPAASTALAVSAATPTITILIAGSSDS